ncbi:MAG: 23S rRNA (adenine(2503)-C(2))-methyltransferase RlmN [Flavobacteriaceae bacterium]|jgi:23S rRNA (adenine2503-C2)-methyltransferase|nr:23S rRNA (adenine(2503)-C(2))-methyltransferase RlmN [Flavobacteriaceae bacterium]|tara:strand:- start:1937 stop:2980 length:1044 start_codon:yes stop_codon:yes gene_type:complete
MSKKDIRSLSLDQIKKFFLENGFKDYRGDQVYSWLWEKSAINFQQMTNLPKSIRSILEESFIVNHIRVHTIQKSKDGTIKNGIKLFDDLIVESVLIPTKKRITACISSQVGCSLNCKFCATARLKRMRNLNPDEIYDQVALISKQSKEYYNRSLTNIVFMGMGEPLMNYKNVIEAIKMITSKKGLGISARRIVVSTSGIPKMIKKMADENVKFKLAVSLHSAVDSIRTSIMPFNEKMNLSELKLALKYWYKKTKRIITYEYVVWKGINDTIEDANALVDFCKFAPSKVNLIQYNSIDDNKFSQASKDNIYLYQKILEENNINVTIRRSRGQDIDAACGQLANKPSLN